MAADHPPLPTVPARYSQGLLDHLSATALDEDYAQAAARRGPAPRGRPGAGVLGVVVLVVFGGLLGLAAVQTSREASDSASSKAYLVRRVLAGKQALAEQREAITTLKTTVAAEQRQLLSSTAQGRSVQSRVQALGVASSAVPVTGPGVRVVVSDARHPASDEFRVHDKDLQKLVNGLWQSGAEAIAINGQRLSSLSAIRYAGEAITVNFRSLRPPYEVAAIGSPDRLATRFIDTAGGRWWLDLHAVYRLPFDINSEESLTLPAARRLTLRDARPARSAR